MQNQRQRQQEAAAPSKANDNNANDNANDANDNHANGSLFIQSDASTGFQSAAGSHLRFKSRRIQKDSKNRPDGLVLSLSPNFTPDSDSVSVCDSDLDSDSDSDSDEREPGEESAEETCGVQRVESPPSAEQKHTSKPSLITPLLLPAGSKVTEMTSTGREATSAFDSQLKTTMERPRPEPKRTQENPKEPRTSQVKVLRYKNNNNQNKAATLSGHVPVSSVELKLARVWESLVSCSVG
ncbi:uncharacterized protein V6R79_021477 [Siganus canaliculatus]